MLNLLHLKMQPIMVRKKQTARPVTKAIESPKTRRVMKKKKRSHSQRSLLNGPLNTRSHRVLRWVLPIKHLRLEPTTQIG
jgi:hypothetical protein